MIFWLFRYILIILPLVNGWNKVYTDRYNIRPSKVREHSHYEKLRRSRGSFAGIEDFKLKKEMRMFGIWMES